MPYQVRAVIFALPAVLIGMTVPHAIASFLDPLRLSDFEQYYTAGWILREHLGHDLYSFQVNALLAKQHAGLATNMWVHPAFEAILFYPFAFLSYRVAYFAYFAFNSALLYLTHRILRPRLLALCAFGSWLPGSLYPAFLPIPHALILGHDSVLFLFLITLAFSGLTKSQFLWAGIFIGLGSFRFQNTLVILALLIVWRMWRVVYGYLISSGVYGLVWLAIAGPRSMLDYIRVLKWLDHYAIMNSYMVSVRGILAALGYESKILTACVALIVIAIAAWLGRGKSQETRLMIALCAMCLASFHMFVYDLSVLIVPILVSLNSAIARRDYRDMLSAGSLIAAPTLLYAVAPGANFSWMMCFVEVALIFCVRRLNSTRYAVCRKS